MLLVYQLPSNFCACLLAPVPRGKFIDDTTRLTLYFHLFLFYHFSLVPIVPVLSPVKFSIMLQYIRIVFSCHVTKYMINRPLKVLNSGIFWNINYWKAQFLAFIPEFLVLTLIKSIAEVKFLC